MGEAVESAPLKKMILGDKPWFKSMTTWGMIVFAAASAGVTQACGDGVIGAGACDTIATVLQYVGGAMTVLGLRRAAVSPNVR